MILALAHLALTLGQVPSDAPVPPALRAADVPASVQMSETHFRAKSFVHERQWLVFSNHARGLVHVRGLGPFEEALLPIEEGGAAGMSIELIASTEAGVLLSSGTFRCEALAGATTFLERDDAILVGWRVERSGRSMRRVNGAPTGRDLRAFSAPPRHVPVPLPSENRRTKKGKRLRGKKLPPR